MTRIFFFAILFLISQGSSAKGLIDEWNGYKSIQLDRDRNSFRDLILIEKNDNFLIYLYNASDLNLYKVFGDKYDHIELWFNEASNKLERIIISKVFFGKDCTLAASHSYSMGLKFAKVFQQNGVVQDDHSTILFNGKYVKFGIMTICSETNTNISCIAIWNK